MTDRRDPNRKLLADITRVKRERDAFRAALARQTVVLQEVQLDAIRSHLRGRLLRIEDFQLFIGLENVLAEDGRIDWRELELRLTNLLHRRPELGINANVGSESYTSP